MDSIMLVFRQNYLEEKEDEFVVDLIKKILNIKSSAKCFYEELEKKEGE